MSAKHTFKKLRYELIRFPKPKYDLKCGSIIFLHCQMNLLLFGLTTRGEFGTDPAEIARRIPFLYAYFKGWDMIDNMDNEKAHKTQDTDEIITFRITKQEIVAWLTRSLFLSQLINSRFFIRMKSALPGLEKTLNEGINFDEVSPGLQRMKTFEGIFDSFCEDAAILMRFAKREFGDDERFLNKLIEIENEKYF